MAKEVLSQDLADFLVTKNFDPEYFDEQGQPSEAGEAKTLKFDYVSQSGKNYGTAVIVIADDDLSFFFGDNLGRGMESEDKQEWYEFLEQLSDQAASHSVTWSPSDINRLKHTLAGIAAIKEGLFEGYYGTRKVRYMGEQTDARLVIKHNRTLGEADKRYRYVESLFIETADEQRFKLPFRSLAGGRAMLEHVRSGGKPYDVRGTHIAEIVSEMAVLSRFHRAQQHRIYEGVTQELVESAKEYYRNLQGTLKHLGSPRGYQQYFESWMPDSVGEAESLVEDLRNLFVEQSVDARIEAALPTLAKIQQQGTKMKEAEIFESWINQLSEGTWALPDTPEAQEKLNQLMSSELIVGPDATNATEQLYDVIGDDKLFDILSDLADRDPRANCWDDSDVQRRLAELGIQTPQSTQAEPADVDQDEAPAVKEQSVAEGDNTATFVEELDEAPYDGPYDKPIKFQPGDSQAYRDAMTQGRGITIQNRADDAERRLAQRAAEPKTLGQKIARDIGDPLKQMAKGDVKGALFDPPASSTNKVGGGGRGGGGGFGGGSMGGKRPGDLDPRFNPLKLENAELARMLEHAGVPLKEAVLRDDTGNTWDHLLDRFRHEVEQFKDGGELDSDLYDALFDYYMQHGAMPYGVAKGRTGDPFNWVSDRLADDLGMNENLIVPQIMPVSEGSCNMTAEGAYCPEHGLAECGGMYEDGGAVGMPYSMGEDEDDFPPIEIRGVGNLINDIPAASKLINPMQPRRSNALSQLEPGDSASHPPVARVDLSMDEGTDDPINSNSAMTGSYYEGKETDIQEGDALLARIKSLALLR